MYASYTCRALPRTVLHVQELSYTCRNYMQIAINCPTHAGNVKCSGTAKNCPTCARIIWRLPEGVPHLQEIFLHCERLSFMCRNYSSIICTCWNYFKFHMQEVWELFLNHAGSLKTVLHIFLLLQVQENLRTVLYIFLHVQEQVL